MIRGFESHLGLSKTAPRGGFSCPNLGPNLGPNQGLGTEARLSASEQSGTLPVANSEPPKIATPTLVAPIEERPSGPVIPSSG